MKSFILKIAPIWVFLFFLVIFLGVQFSGPQLSSQDDPAYHIAHALSYITGKSWDFPVYSTLSERPVDLWWLYHILLSKFLFGFTGSNFEVLVTGVKLLHSLLGSAVFLMFFLVLKKLISEESSVTGYDIKTVTIHSFVATLFLFFSSGVFIFRLFYYRPHVISIILVFLTFFFNLRRKYFLTFALAFLAPLFYSASFLVLIPSAVFVLCDAAYHRKSVKSLRTFYPVLIPLGGLALGVFAHPDFLHYLYNGFYLIILLLMNFFSGKLPEGGELNPLSALANFIPSILFLVIFFIYYIRVHESKSLQKSISFDRLYTLIICHTFFALMLVVARASEYAIPLIVLFSSWVISCTVIPYGKRLIAGEFDSMSSSAVVTELIGAGKAMLSGLVERGSAFRKIFWGIFIAYIVVTTIKLSASINTQPPVDLYRGAAEFMKEHSQEGEIVFQQRFDMYPRLVFFNNHNRYIAGIANTYLFQYSNDLYWLWEHIIKGDGEICTRKKCMSGEGYDMYTIIKDVFMARFIFIDATSMIGDMEIDSNQRFIEKMDADPRFKKVFVDERYPEIMVYDTGSGLLKK